VKQAPELVEKITGVKETAFMKIENTFLGAANRRTSSSL
jgi:hypothetical protein